MFVSILCFCPFFLKSVMSAIFVQYSMTFFFFSSKLCHYNVIYFLISPFSFQNPWHCSSFPTNWSNIQVETLHASSALLHTYISCSCDHVYIFQLLQHFTSSLASWSNTSRGKTSQTTLRNTPQLLTFTLSLLS